MSQVERTQFWEDLATWPKPEQVDWAHFLVNEVLPGDWVGGNGWQEFFVPRAPLTIEEVNEKVAELGLQIPPTWRP